jgi:serine/threonine protein kinase
MADSAHPKTIGKYEVLSVIGEGGMGIVYKARDPIIGRTVAIKTILTEESGAGEDQQLLARLRMDAKAAGRLQHPNIVTVFDFGQQDDLSFLVMEYVEGANLARIIGGGVPLSLDQKMEIAIQLADALAYAHSLGVIHRDIKPANICVTREGSPKILDFGLARFDETKLTRTGLTSGTLIYMSPERMSGESGPSDDIFALGAVIYELLTAQQAFPGNKYSEIVNNILSGNYPIPPSQVADLPNELDPVIAKATARAKAMRYQNASELARALRDVQQSQTFRRRAAAQHAPIEFKTMAMQYITDNPYTAGSVQAPTNEVHEIHTMRDFTADPAASMPTDAFALRDAERTMERAALAGDPMQTVALTPEERPVRVSSAPPTLVGSVAPTVIAPRGTADQQKPTEMLSAVHFAKTEETKAPTSSLFERTRTVVARAWSGVHRRAEFGESEAGAAPVTIMEKVAAPAKRVGSIVATAVLVLAVGAAPVAASGGIAAYLGVYAVAVAAWFFMIRSFEKPPLKVIFILAGAMHLAVAFQEPLSRALLERDLAAGLKASPPVAALLFGGLNLIEGALLARRLLLIVAALVAIRVAWDELKPRRALGIATFPLLIIEGTLNARIEVLAALLLFVALFAIQRSREGWGGVAAFLAYGLFTPAIVTLPEMWEQSYHVAPLLFAGIVMIALTKWILPGADVWTQSFATMVGTSPILAGASRGVESVLHARGVAAWINHVTSTSARRLGITPIADTSDHGLAIGLIVLGVIVLASFASQRAKVTEAAVADALGITLILCVTRDPAAWLLVVPFAIVSNRKLWLLIAICSPLLLISTTAEVNWIVWVTSLIVPLAWWLGLKLQEAAAENEEGAPAAAH